ncbi:FAD:protein FMN transferase [Mycoplasmatota bacterium WC44]
MKKLMILLFLLAGCTVEEKSEIDCELFPSATVCQEVDEVEKPIIIPEDDEEEEVIPEENPEEEPEEEVEEIPPYNICDDYPNHAECMGPLKSYQIHSYPDGNRAFNPFQFFDAYISMQLYLSPDQNEYVYTSIYNNLGEKYHQLSDKYNYYDGIVNVKTINDNPEETHYLSKELYDLIKFSVTNSELTKGYFDISIGAASSIWHYYREKCTTYNFHPSFCFVPKTEELESIRDKVDISKIILNDEEMSITMEEGMSLDLGGVAKGYFVEILAQKFIDNGARTFLINAGGNIKTYGSKPNGEFFTLGIQDPTLPRGQGKLSFDLNIPGGYSVVTSGDNVRYYKVDGEVYHHIINPYTLVPDRYSRQVTIITNDSRAADILSTTVYLMTVEDGIEYVNSLENVEAIWYGLDNGISYSKNVMKFISG